MLTPPPEATAGETDRTSLGDPHLRSFREVTTYRAWTTDGFAGFVEDFFVDDSNWEIGCLRVALGEWWPHKMAGLKREQVSEISWREKLVRFSLSRKEMEQAPPPARCAAAPR